MWTHSKQLPDWAFKQQEINGNKNVQEKTAAWFVEEIVSNEGELRADYPSWTLSHTLVFPGGDDPLERTGNQPPKQPRKMNFFKKFAELQMLMLQHNAGLTASHPYASSPINWPFLLSGISFWTQNEGQKQIYMIGNLVGWWACVVALSVYVGILGADLLGRRRDLNPIGDGAPFIDCSSLVITDIAHRGTQPDVELSRLLPARLGRTLLPVLLDEPPAVHPPLPTIARCVRPRCRCRAQLHPVRDDQLPDFNPRTTHG